MNIAFNHQNALVTKTLDLVLKGAGCLSSHTTVTVRRSSGPNILPLVYCQHRTRNIFYQKGFNKEGGKERFVWDYIRKSTLESLPSSHTHVQILHPHLQPKLKGDSNDTRMAQGHTSTQPQKLKNI